MMYETPYIYLPNNSSKIINLATFTPTHGETYINTMPLTSVTPIKYTNVLSNMFNAGAGYINYLEPTKCIAGDAYSLVLWIKRTSNINNSGHLEIIFKIGLKEDNIYLESNEISTNYRMIVLSLTSYESFNTLGFDINITGNLELELGRLEIFNNNLKTKYEYEDVNLVGKENGEFSSYNSYNSNNIVDGSYGNGLNTTMGAYNSNNLIALEAMPYGVIKEYSYNTSLQKTNEILKENDITKWQENYYYNSNKELSSFSNKYNETSSYTYQDHNLTKVTIGNYITTRYGYNKYDDITQVSVNTLYHQTITYDSDYRNVTKAKLLNNSEYNYYYNAKKLLEEIKFQNTSIEKYTYDNNGLITEIRKGDKLIKITYNSDKIMTKIQLTSLDGYIVEREFCFEYDDKKRLKRVKDDNNDYIKKYVYDNKDNLITLAYPKLNPNPEELNNYELNFSYHQNKLAYRIYNKEGDKVYIEQIGINNSISRNPLYFENYIRNTLNLMGTTYNYDPNLKGKDCESNYFEVVSGANPFVPHNNIFCLDTFSNTKIIGYKGPEQSNNRTIGIAMWICPVGIVDENPIFDICENDTNNTIRVSCFIDDYKIKVKIKNLNGNYINILESVFYVSANRWQFVGFSYEYDTATSKHIYYLNFDGRTQKLESPNSNYNIGTIVTPNYYIGYSRDCHYAPEFAGYITALSISNGNVITKEDLDTYYKFSKEFIFKPEEDDDTVNVSSTTEYSKELLTNYDIIPLHSSVISLKNKKPIKYNYLSSGRFVHNNFNYNKELKNMCYSLSEELTYNYKLTNSGTVVINCFIESFSGKAYLIKNESSSKASVYIMNNQLCFEYKSDINGTLHIISTGITPTLNEWHIIGLSYKNINHQVYYNIFYDNTIINNEDSPISINSDMGEMLTTIGQECDGNHTLYGNVHMAVISDYYLDSSNYSSFKNNLVYYSSLNKYDKFNHIFKKEINKNRTNIFTTTFEYDNDRIISQTSATIQKNYSYNTFGNISQITDSGTYNHSYGYDKYNRIVNYDNTSNYYSYDSEGNIISAGNTSFIYDSDTKMLASVNNNSITYSTDNPLLPIHYDNIDFEWLGTKLSNATISLSNNEKIVITFEYNEQGLRTKKTEIHKQGDTTIYTNYFNYYYDENNKLITEIRNNDRYDYLYDDTEIYGYILNLSTRYYYVKDIIGQIIGIVNEEGTVIGRYDYDPYGNIIINTVGSSNKILYKGYYYDDYIELYYLKSRYYSPEWHRFISPDSVDYLDIYDLNGINLFSYCNNNPVMYVDGDGTFALLIIGALIGLGIAAAIDSKDGKMFNGDVKWYDYLGAAILGGAVGGFAGAIASTTFSFSLPTFGLINTGGSLAFGITGSIELSITGTQILTGFVAGGLIINYIIPYHGEPNSTINDHGNIGYYDDNGNLTKRVDNVGKRHYIKELGDYYLPHTHRFEWKLIKGVWRIVKKWVWPF